MKRDLGNVEYDADAALYPGASYQEETDMFSPGNLLVDGDDELLDDAAADDKKLLEARMIAKTDQRAYGNAEGDRQGNRGTAPGAVFGYGHSAAKPERICRPFCCCVK